MKYKFNNLEEAKIAIEKWFKDCGHDEPDIDGKQKDKIFEEIAELEAEIKSSNVEGQKNEAGDVLVTLVGKKLKDGGSLNTCFVYTLSSDINYLLHLIKYRTEIDDFNMSVEYLNDLCKTLNINLLECATMAYNKIQGRLERGELKVVNGTITKGN